METSTGKLVNEQGRGSRHYKTLSVLEIVQSMGVPRESPL